MGTGLASYVWAPMQQVQGFVQMLKRPGRHEADLLFLAPRLEQSPNGQAAWESLLSACVAEASAQALRRLFVSVPEGRAEIDVLASLGFMVYTSEEVFVLSSPPGLPAAAGRPAAAAPAARGCLVAAPAVQHLHAAAGAAR